MLLDKNYNEVQLNEFIPFAVYENKPDFLAKIVNQDTEKQIILDVYKVVPENDVFEIELYLSSIFIWNPTLYSSWSWDYTLQGKYTQESIDIIECNCSKTVLYNSYTQLLFELQNYCEQHFNIINEDK